MKLNKSFNNFKYNKFNSSVNEWPNSIYSFNKNNLNTLWCNRMVFDLINSYFNIKPNNVSILKKINKKFSLKRIFVSIPEIKVSLNNTNILVYIFNKENFILKKKLTILLEGYLNKKTKVQKPKNMLPNKKSNLNYKKKAQKTTNILFNYALNNNNNVLPINKNKFWNNVNFFSYIKSIVKNFYNFNVNIEIKEVLCKKIYIPMYKLNNTYNKLKEKYYVLFFYKRYVTRLYFNKLKFNSINLFNLNKILYKIYNTRVNVNVISLKNLHLDNSLFIEAIVRKLRKRNRKILKVLRKALILPKIPKIDSMFLLKKENIFNKVTYNFSIFNQYMNIKNISKTIFKSLKGLHVIGVRLEGKGRLTKRLTASRAVFKKAYIGNLKNIYSSSKGLSAVTSRGFDKPNLNYTNLNSYNRNGSYGIKSWQNTI